MFKIVEQPNGFFRNARKLANNGDLSESETRRLEFWTLFNDVVEQRGKPFNKHKATIDHWYTVAVGSSQCYISIDLVNKEHKIRVGLWITDNKPLFDDLYTHKEEIEHDLGESLEWDRLDNKKASVASLAIPGLDFNHQENYPSLMNMAIDKVVSLRNTIKNYI